MSKKLIYRKLEPEEVIQEGDIVAMHAHVGWPPTAKHLKNLDKHYLATTGYVKLKLPRTGQVGSWIGLKVKDTPYHVGRLEAPPKKPKQIVTTYRKLEGHEIIKKGDIIACKDYVKWPPKVKNIKEINAGRHLSPFSYFTEANASIGNRVADTGYIVGRLVEPEPEEDPPLKMDWIDD